MQKIKLFMDPLCGWCYAAAPEVKKLAETAAIELIPTGLFSQAGRTVTPEFARHAWSNDQRIAQLTGQVFSDSYRDNLLQEGMPFNSFPIVLALTWVQQQAPEQELNAYHAIQTARYVDGRDNTQLPVLANILANLPLALSEAEILQALQDEALVQQTEQRLAAGQAEARQFAVQGVPSVFAETGQGWQQVKVY
jgi:putative protein-disulfide isomerase